MSTSAKVVITEDEPIIFPNDYVFTEGRFTSVSQKFIESKDPAGYEKYIIDLVNKMCEVKKNG